jgi:hypothetical protein
MGIWAYGHMGIWAYGHMGIWAYGIARPSITPRSRKDTGAITQLAC